MENASETDLSSTLSLQTNTQLPTTQDEELIPLSALAPGLPDPARRYYWFSNTVLPHLKLPAGMPVLCPAGRRLPLDADWWCHEGDSEWTKVVRTDANPKPRPKKKKKTKRKPKAVD